MIAQGALCMVTDGKMVNIQFGHVYSELTVFGLSRCYWSKLQSPFWVASKAIL